MAGVDVAGPLSPTRDRTVGREDQIVVLAEAIVREERARELLVGRFGNPALHGAVTALTDSTVARGVVIRTVMGRRIGAGVDVAGDMAAGIVIQTVMARCVLMRSRTFAES